MRPLRPLAIRTRLLGVVLLTTAIALAVLVTAFNLVLRSTNDDDATSVAQARAAAVVSTLEIVDGHIQTHEAPDDSAIDVAVWVFGDGRLVEGPQASTPPRDVAAADAAARAPAVRDAPGLRLASAEVTSGGRTVGAVVAGVPLTPYQATARSALIGSILLAVGLLVVIAVLAAWTLRRALRPVHEMTGLAAEWSERDPERRFAQGPPRDELTELAATLDTLLARLAAGLRREQRFSAELAHELRTPLSRIIAQCELALREMPGDGDAQEAFRSIARSADEMRRTTDVLVAAARHGAGHHRGATDAAALLDDLARRAQPGLASRALELTTTVATPSRISIDVDLAARIIEPVMDNAVRHAARRVSVTASTDADHTVIVVEDDGAGVAAADRDRIFEAGERGSGTTGEGAGLGLALARRLAADVAGSVDVEESVAGARFAVRLPRI